MIETEEVGCTKVFLFLIRGESLKNTFVVVVKHRFRVISGQINWIGPETKLKIIKHREIIVILT